MDILTNSVPLWASIHFLISILMAIFMIANVAKQGAPDKAKANKIFIYVFGFYILYFIYVAIMSFTGIFHENTIPPKILFYTALPLFIFLNFIVARTSTFKSIFQSIPLKSLVILHTFRFIGAFFLITNVYGAIPTKFAYIGGLGDIATAVLSIFVANAIDAQKPYAKKLTFFWNIFGICDIISVLFSAVVTTKLSLETGSQALTEIATFPFSLIPAFAPATIIFLHICIFKKLRQYN